MIYQTNLGPKCSLNNQTPAKENAHTCYAMKSVLQEEIGVRTDITHQ